MAASQQRRNQGQAGQPYRPNTYIDGNTVRKVQYQVFPEEQAFVQEQPRRQRQPAKEARKGRGVKLSLGYVAFITAAAAATLFIAVNYLKLQSESTALRNEITSLESQYSSLKMGNDEEYARIVSDVDLEYVRDVAINRLGMVYASTGQVVTYNGREGDYVRQYEDVPEE